MKLQIIATQADGGDTNAALLFDEIVAKAETRPSSPPPAALAAPQTRPAATRSTTSMLRAARAAGPRIASHSLGRRRSV